MGGKEEINQDDDGGKKSIDTYGKHCDVEISYDLAFIDWMLEGGKSQIQLIVPSQNDLESHAAICNRDIREDTSRWKDDELLVTILNVSCPNPFKWRSQKAGESAILEVRAGEVHLSCFHIE